MFSVYIEWQIIHSSFFILHSSFFTLHLQSLGNVYCFRKRSELVVTLFQLILVVALRHDTTTSLEPKLAISADEGTDDDGLVEVAVQTDEADAATVSTTVVWLQF